MIEKRMIEKKMAGNPSRVLLSFRVVTLRRKNNECVLGKMEHFAVISTV